MGVLSYLLSNQPVGAGAAAVTGRDIVRVSQDPAISGSVRKPGGIAFRICATQRAAANDSTLFQVHSLVRHSRHAMVGILSHPPLPRRETRGRSGHL